jgi:hypothetical protein
MAMVVGSLIFIGVSMVVNMSYARGFAKEMTKLVIARKSLFGGVR